MAESEISRLQERVAEAEQRCTEAGEQLRGLGFEPHGALLPGQPSIDLTEAQVAALAELRAADEEAAAAREELSLLLKARAGDAHR